MSEKAAPPERLWWIYVCPACGAAAASVDLDRWGHIVRHDDLCAGCAKPPVHIKVVPWDTWRVCLRAMEQIGALTNASELGAGHALEQIVGVVRDAFDELCDSPEHPMTRNMPKGALVDAGGVDVDEWGCRRRTRCDDRAAQ